MATAQPLRLEPNTASGLSRTLPPARCPARRTMMKAELRRRVFFMHVPQSDAPFMKAYPAETTEAFFDGHVSALGFFGGVPLSIPYDNTKLAVTRICGRGKREQTRAFSELASHYLFLDRFGRPGKGNDKGRGASQEWPPVLVTGVSLRRPADGANGDDAGLAAVWAYKVT